MTMKELHKKIWELTADALIVSDNEKKANNGDYTTHEAYLDGRFAAMSEVYTLINDLRSSNPALFEDK